MLFALTPRAGARHHVYLVPRNDPGTRQQWRILAHDVDSAVRQWAGNMTGATRSQGHSCDRGGRFVVAWRRVIQPTTGRPGMEWICWTPDRPAARSLVRFAGRALEGVLERVDRVVTDMDWSTKGPEFEVVEALDEWERELEQAASQEASAAPTPQPCQVEQPNEAKRSRSCASRTGGKFMRWWLLVSALLLAIVLVVWGCLAWPGERPEGAQQPAAGTRQPGELSRLAETLGVATSGSKENLEAQCAEKLKALFVWPEDRLPGTPREQVEVALRQFVGWTEKDPEADRLSLAQLVASDRTLARLERMFPKENGYRFDASGLLEYRDLRRWLAGVDRPWLQEFGRALQD
jgi:hypothetical protein